MNSNSTRRGSKEILHFCFISPFFAYPLPVFFPFFPDCDGIDDSYENDANASLSLDASSSFVSSLNPEASNLAFVL